MHNFFLSLNHVINAISNPMYCTCKSLQEKPGVEIKFCKIRIFVNTYVLTTWMIVLHVSMKVLQIPQAERWVLKPGIYEILSKNADVLPCLT